MPVPRDDQDRAKGATETEDHSQSDNVSQAGQLGHRDQDPLLEGADTDFPEPGESPEHSGTTPKPKRPDAGKRQLG